MFNLAFIFRGVFDNLYDIEAPKCGDIAYKDGIFFLFDGKEWEKIGEPTDISTKQCKHQKIMYDKKCKNCGAPLVDNKCDYCGSVYEYKEKLYD